jgi:hypothetical protein
VERCSYLICCVSPDRTEALHLVTLPRLHVLYFAPLTSEEGEDAFRNILATFGN